MGEGRGVGVFGSFKDTLAASGVGEWYGDPPWSVTPKDLGFSLLLKFFC